MSSVGAYSPKQDDAPVDESWPTEGVPSSMYSRHKVAAERLLDRLESDTGRGGPVITRLRPGIVGQRSAGSALLRYGLPGALPSSLLRHVPILPLDRGLTIPMVHADDVASAVVSVLESRAPGAFNLAAEPPVTAADIAAALGARLVQVPAAAVRVAVSLSWRARVQQVDAGWVDMGYAVPLLDSSRAASELGWSPATDALSVLSETVSGMRDASSDHSPVLRPRSVAGALGRFARRGPVASREQP
jgi:nucleoside-diphosphate-sugar epimerase